MLEEVEMTLYDAKTGESTKKNEKRKKSGALNTEEILSLLSKTIKISKKSLIFLKIFQIYLQKNH